MEEQPIQPAPTPAPPQPVMQEKLPQHHFIAIGIVLLIVLLVIGVAAVKGVQKKPQHLPAKQPLPTITPFPTSAVSQLPSFTAPANWKVYTNKRKPITFAYPETFSESTLGQPYYSLPVLLAIVAGPSGNYTAPTYTQESVFAVSTNPDTSSCFIDTKTNQPMTQAVQSSAGTFYVTDSSNAGAGNVYESRYYRIVSNNTCYELALTVHTATDGNNIDFSAVDVSKKAAMTELEQMVTTFKFVQLVAPTAGIPGRFVDGDLGISLSYPLTIAGEQVSADISDYGVFTVTKEDRKMSIIISKAPSYGASLSSYTTKIIDDLTMPPPIGGKSDSNFRYEMAKRITREQLTVGGSPAEKIISPLRYYVFVVHGDNIYTFELNPYSADQPTPTQQAWIDAFTAMVASVTFMQ